MLPLNDTTAIKTVATNITAALNEIQYDQERGLSRLAALNLAARAFGYKNYNTYKGTIKKAHTAKQTEETQSLFQTLSSDSISPNDVEQFNRWINRYAPPALADFKSIASKTADSEAGVYFHYLHIMNEIMISVLTFLTAYEVDHYEIETRIIDDIVFTDFVNERFVTEHLLSKINDMEIINTDLKALEYAFELVLRKGYHLRYDSHKFLFSNRPEISKMVTLNSIARDTHEIDQDALEHLFGPLTSSKIDSITSDTFTALIEGGESIEIAPVQTFYLTDNETVVFQMHELFIKYMNDLSEVKS